MKFSGRRGGKISTDSKRNALPDAGLLQRDYRQIVLDPTTRRLDGQLARSKIQPARRRREARERSDAGRSSWWTPGAAISSRFLPP